MYFFIIISSYFQRSEQISEGHAESGPHLTYFYNDKSIIEDACTLIMHHMKRQSSE